MKEYTEKINITPDKTLFPKLGQAGYTVAEALAELIDNSIDARDESVNIRVIINPREDYIEVFDDGVGMKKNVAAQSIVLGRSSKKTGELGQFGIGLKTACMSLGKKFTIETTSKGSDEIYIINFDEEEFIKNGSWSDFEIKIKKGGERLISYTKIIIKDLRIKYYPTLNNVVSAHLSERFAPFIKNKEVIITLNNHKLIAEETRIVEDTKKDFLIKLSNGEKISGWTGILQVGSIERSGFDLYRYKRLIRAHEKLGYIYHPSKMMIVGEIHMDPLPVTTNKREFITENPLYIEFFDKFQKILKPILAEAQKRHQQEKINNLPKELRETLKDNLLKALNKTEDFRELAFPNVANRSKNTDKEGIFDNQEKREKNGESIAQIQEKNENFKKRTPQKRSENKVRYITIAGKRYKFDYDWRPLDESIAKESYLDKETSTIVVILNSKYHILNVIKPDLFYHAVYLTEGIVQVFLKENDQPTERMTILRDKLMKQLADVISEDTENKMRKRDGQILNAQSYLLKNKNTDTKKLSSNEKIALQLRFEQGLTYKLIARELRVSVGRIQQLLRSALNKISDVQVVSEIQNESDSIETIIEDVANKYDIKKKDLFSKSRKADLILPRHLLMYLLRKKTNLSFPEIARLTKRNDHTTIIHAYKKIESLMKENKI